MEKETKKKKKTNPKDEEISLLEATVEELNDKYLRLYSEFDNYRRRTLKEKNDLSKTAAEDIMVSLLPVLDDLERALKSTLRSADDQEVVSKEGLVLIYQKFNSLLAQKGLEPITAMGETFNVDFHDAITNIPAPSEEMKGRVVEEVERGYQLNDKVIRYAKVIVGS
ncbi:MAG: nucleotide exchange factor GrpE [Bacteroidales bacterium]|nr:nucleotide exchange factor GrpE [Bacteroidales bacterium]